MPIPPYITYRQNNLTLKDLLSQITAALSDGVTSLRLSSTLEFEDGNGSPEGQLRYNDTNGALEYTNDGGTSWNRLHSDTYVWEAGKSYVAGAVVQYQDGWYVCVSATSSAIPGQSVEWRLLTGGTVVQIAVNATQFKRALETADATNVTIYLKGAIAGPIEANITASVVTIWSDETTTLSGSIQLVPAGSCSVYWHASGTSLTSAAYLEIVSPGVLWIDRMKASAAALTLTGTVYYQRIDGTVNGGTQTIWDDVIDDSRVPKDLSTLTGQTYSNALRLYVSQTGVSGYITAQTLVTEAANLAASTFHVDMSDVIANIPSTAARGYVFYATDTGDLYIMGDGNHWNDPIHIQGPQGNQGVQGNTGYTVVPMISEDYDLSWQVTQGATPPTPPATVNIKGASAFDIWKEEQGTESSTEQDFLEALGIGNRRMPFSSADLIGNTITFYTSYPFIAILDRQYRQWYPSRNEVLYGDVGGKQNSVTVDLSSIFNTTTAANITIAAGTYYRDAANDTAGVYGWKRVDGNNAYQVYTATETPSVGSYAYEDTTLAGTSYEITVYNAASSLPMTGTWYGLFGGGGMAGDIEIVKTVQLAYGQDAYAAEVPTAYITISDVVYLRNPSGDANNAFAWTANGVGTGYTAQKNPAVGDNVYQDSSLTTSIGVVGTFVPASNSTHRKYELGIPQGEPGENGRDGQDGADGQDGQDGTDAYVYVAWASDSSGTGFSLTPSSALPYRAELHTDHVIATPTMADFTGVPFVDISGISAAEISVAMRQPATAYSSGARALYPQKAGYILVCTTTGTTAAVLPAWPVTIRSGVTTLTDGTAVWTIHDAIDQIPKDVPTQRTISGVSWEVQETVEYATLPSNSVALLLSTAVFPAGTVITLRVSNNDGGAQTFGATTVIDTTDTGVYMLTFINITGNRIELCGEKVELTGAS